MRRYLPILPRRPGIFGCVILAVLPAFFGCDDDDGNCRSGYPCECYGTDDCYLDCRGSDCELAVHDVVRGDGVCGYSCDSSCFAVTDCGLTCADSCSSQVHDATSSDTVCGDACDHECFDVESCDVRAGEDSHIRCHNLGTCNVELTGPGGVVECHSVSSCRVSCVGSCRLEYTAVGAGEPELVCPRDAPLVECSETVKACGDCAG